MGTNIIIASGRQIAIDDQGRMYRDLTRPSTCIIPDGYSTILLFLLLLLLLLFFFNDLRHAPRAR